MRQYSFYDNWYSEPIVLQGYYNYSTITCGLWWLYLINSTVICKNVCKKQSHSIWLSPSQNQHSRKRFFYKACLNILNSGLDLSLTAGIPNACGGFVPTSNFMMESYQLTIPPGQQSASTLLSLLDDDIIEVRGCIVISISSVSWGSGREGLQQTTSARTPFVIVVQDDDTGYLSLIPQNFQTKKTKNVVKKNLLYWWCLCSFT